MNNHDTIGLAKLLAVHVDNSRQVDLCGYFRGRQNRIKPFSVEVVKNKLVPIGRDPAASGIEVQTGSPEVIQARKLVLELLLARCPNLRWVHSATAGVERVLTPDAAESRLMARAAEIELAIIAESARWGDALASLGSDAVGITVDLSDPENAATFVEAAAEQLGGSIDIVVANDTVQNFLFHNLGNETFEEIGSLAGIAYSQSAGRRPAATSRWNEEYGQPPAPRASPWRTGST